MTRFLTTSASLALFCFAAACGDYAERLTCTPQALPGCVPDTSEFTVPDAVGPNPNFPDPSKVQPSMAADDRLGEVAWESVLNINEVLLAPSREGEAQKVELAFAGIGSASLEGFTLRAGDLVIDLSEVSIANGAFHTVELDAARAINAEAGSLALVDKNGRIVDYVQWGAAGQALEAEAVLDGQWNAGEFCVLPEQGTSLSYFAQYARGKSTDAWWAQYQSFGTVNPPRKGVPSIFDGTSE
ncbi:MAG: hypothetical protein KDB07_12420 [Planctomycetes bacterium]|nr:hypothetical protein [Planctomycetota bacterium]